MDISVVITTFKEDYHLKNLLKNLSSLEIKDSKVEIIIIDASDFSIHDAKELLGKNSAFLKFYNIQNISRTSALNKLINIASGEIIIRLDARSRVDKDYIYKIANLSKTSKAENVGGVMFPVSESKTQKIISDLMSHPFCFGGSNFRKTNYSGYVDSVYLGAYKKSFLTENTLEFDVIHPNISEDSDLNYRLIKAGGKIYMDSNIIIKHLPRENLISFFKLCFNYGIGRGLFIIKNKKIPAIRQLIPILSFFLGSILFFFSFYSLFSRIILSILVLLYLSFALYFSFKISKSIICHRYIIGFIGSHIYWTLGMLLSPYKFYKNLKYHRENYHD